MNWLIIIAAAAALYFLKDGFGIKSMSYPELVDNYKDIANKVRPSNIPLAFVLAMIFTESAGDREAVGDNGASLGLMQIQKGAWIDSGVNWEYSKSNAFNAEKNISAGTKYLDHLKSVLGGDLDTAIICYNIGVGNYTSGNLIDRGNNYLETVKKHRAKIIPYISKTGV